MTSKEAYGIIAKMAEDYGLSHRDMSAAIGVHPVTVSNWKNGKRLIAPSTEKIIELLQLRPEIIHVLRSI